MDLLVNQKFKALSVAMSALACVTPARAGVCAYEFSDARLTIFTGNDARILDGAIEWKPFVANHGDVAEVWQAVTPTEEEFIFIGNKLVVGVNSSRGQVAFGTTQNPCRPPAESLKSCPDKTTVYLEYLKRQCSKRLNP